MNPQRYDEGGAILRFIGRLILLILIATVLVAGWLATDLAEIIKAKDQAAATSRQQAQILESIAKTRGK